MLTIEKNLFANYQQDQQLFLFKLFQQIEFIMFLYFHESVMGQQQIAAICHAPIDEFQH